MSGMWFLQEILWEMNQSNTFVKHILSDLSATDNLCIVVEFMTWREAQMEEESRELSVA